LPPQLPPSRTQLPSNSSSNQPQPLSRNVRPPPIPADRSSVSSRDKLNPTQQDIDNQMLEFEQQKQLHDKSMQLMRQQQLLQQQQNIRQPSSTAISREYKTNDTSKSGSNISTPDPSRSKKLNQVNNQDVNLINLYPFYSSRKKTKYFSFYLIAIIKSDSTSN